MVTVLFTLVTSVLLGMRHATDPDHIVAVSTIVTQERSVRRASAIGALWGLGHTLTILLVGGTIILFKLTFTPKLSLSMEFVVALMLILLGVLNLLNVRPHSHAVSAARPFIVGVVHGLAGSAAAALLILPFIPDARWAFLYLVVFGAGTIAGMAVITVGIAAPASFASRRLGGMQRWIRVTSGGVSVAFGVMLAYQIGVVNGLFA